MKRKRPPDLRPVAAPPRPEPPADEEEAYARSYWQAFDDEVREAERTLAATLVRRAEATDHRDPDAAKDDLYRAMAVDPSSGAPWYRLAIMEWDDELALESINEALARDTSSYAYWGCRAEIRERLGALEQALADADRAVQLEREHGVVVWLIQRARLHDKLGHWDDARRDFARVVELKPDCAYLLRERAMVLVHRGDLEGARAELERVIAEHPELIVAVREKALLCHRLGDGDEALRAIDHVLAALADDPDCRDVFDHYIRGAILASRGEWAAALAAFDAGNAKEREGQLEIRRAQCLLALDRNREALAACDYALAEYPYHEGFRLWRARARARAGDLRGALDDVRRAIERAPDDARYVAEKAVLHAKSGRRALAQREARRALRMLRKRQPSPRAYHDVLEQYAARGLDLGPAPPVSRAELRRLSSRA